MVVEFSGKVTLMFTGQRCSSSCASGSINIATAVVEASKKKEKVKMITKKKSALGNRKEMNDLTYLQWLLVEHLELAYR